MSKVTIRRGYCGEHNWSNETQRDGKRWCRNPGCEFYKWPDGFIGPWRDSKAVWWE